MPCKRSDASRQLPLTSIRPKTCMLRAKMSTVLASKATHPPNLHQRLKSSRLMEALLLRTRTLHSNQLQSTVLPQLQQQSRARRRKQPLTTTQRSLTSTSNIRMLRVMRVPSLSQCQQSEQFMNRRQSRASRCPKALNNK